ncbi:hypothetical protein [Shewanella sp.]|uniref:hypothetical protein n=1 Tax=Shewanella sp. TaxID=50422 RepID=UPI004047B849
MFYLVNRWIATAAGLIFLATQGHAQSLPPSVTDAQIRFCLNRSDPQCKKVGLALLEEGRISEGFEISRIYAEQGDTDLQMILGGLILMRRTPGSPPHARVFPNPRYYAQASRYWFEKAAQNGNPAALNSIARTYCCFPELGLGSSPTEIQAALPYFRRAAEQGYAPSAYLLGEIYMSGAGVARDREIARSFLRIAASSNRPEANEARTLANQSLAKIDADEQAERQKVIDDRLAQARADREQEQRRLTDLERAERERITQANRIAAEKETARLAKEEEERQRPQREATERARIAKAEEESRRQCEAVARVCRGRPDVNLQVLEELSRQFRVARREIQISRTFVQKGWFGCSCTGVFETPVGSYACGLQQNSSGVVTSARCGN